MASLRAGVLLKLLRCMDSSADHLPFLDPFSNAESPAVLQVTGIIPALAGSDLFPDRGFYLQVSDSSHSTYVSLPLGHDDFVLSDRLRLGQLIHVRHLEPSSPVPILCGLRLLPGCHPFPYDTTAITATMSAKCSKKSPFVDVTPIERERRQTRYGNLLRVEGTKNLSASPARRKEKKRASPALGELSKIHVNCIHEENDDWDGSSVISSTLSSSSCSFSPLVPREKSLRKNWEPTDRSVNLKHETKPVTRTQSATFTQTDLARSYTSKNEGIEVLWTRKRDYDAELKALPNNSTKRKLSTPSKTYSNDLKWPEINVSWGSLSLNLVKHGKEALSQRDTALYTALDALQEACAFEGLIRCLSTYSELQSNKFDPQQVVNKFLDFHQDLSRVAMAAQSSAAKDASDRRACAASWIKAALESELSKAPKKTDNNSHHIESSTPGRKLQSSLSRQRKCTDTAPSGILPLTAAGLAKAMQSECNAWFLRYVEKFLELVHRSRHYTSNESRIASLLCQLKRVDSWLVTVYDEEACGRVRGKIYEFFLRHVESAAMALDSMIASKEAKVQR